MVRIGALTCDDHAKRRDEKNKNRDLLDGGWGRMGKGETEEVRGRKSEARGIDKNARPTQFGSRAYFERSPNSVPNSCHLFFFLPDRLVRQFALLLSSRPSCTSEYTRANRFGTRAAKFRTSIESWPWARFLISLCCMITPTSGLTSIYSDND